MKLSLAITTYNRPELTLKAFEKVLNDPRIDEIVIVDDNSTNENQLALLRALKRINFFNGINKCIWNEKNIGMSLNKKKAIEECKNDWVLLLDSDNQIDSSYLDAWEKVIRPHSDVIFCPSGALPNFDYTYFSGMAIGAEMVRLYSNNQKMNCLLNTCNYIVHRETYLKNYVYNPSIKAADTIWHTYNHLKNGGNLYVVPGMFYEHMVHEKSGWMLDRKENSRKFKEIKQLIMAL